MILLSAALTALFAGLFMVAGHYLLPVILGRELRPPWTYVWGVALGILLPFAGWLGVTPNPGRWLTLLALVIVVCGAGAGTIVCYAADWWMGYRAEKLINGKQRPPAHSDR